VPVPPPAGLGVSGRVCRAATDTGLDHIRLRIALRHGSVRLRIGLRRDSVRLRIGLRRDSVRLRIGLHHHVNMHVGLRRHVSLHVGRCVDRYVDFYDIGSCIDLSVVASVVRPGRATNRKDPK